jgi:bifunctional oligoribonuclease and PAP phosphatase NrnA
MSESFANSTFSLENISQLKALLLKSDKIAIVNHINPDGDAMGSALGLAGILKNLGHQQVQVVTPNDYPPNLHWLAGNELVLNAESDMALARNLLHEADLIFALDFNDPARAGDLEEALASSPAKKVLIDHHQEPTGFAQINFWDPASCATAQLVFELAFMMDWQDAISSELAACFYTGILTDTGSFRFSSTTAQTHQIAAWCLNKGVNPDLIFDALFNQNTTARFKLLGTMLNRMEIFPELQTVLLYLKKEEMEASGYQKGDTEGFVNYGLSISGIRFAAFFIERENLTKISFRSKGDFDVNTFSRAHFNGGGHRNAAGGSCKEGLTYGLNKFRNIIKEYQDALAG